MAGVDAGLVEDIPILATGFPFLAFNRGDELTLLQRQGKVGSPNVVQRADGGGYACAFTVIIYKNAMVIGQVVVTTRSTDENDLVRCFLQRCRVCVSALSLLPLNTNPTPSSPSNRTILRKYFSTIVR